MIGVFEKKSYFRLNCQLIRGFPGYVPMFHPHAELVCVLEGSLPVTVDGHAHTLQAGELAVVFPYLTHSYENAPGASAIILMFDPKATVFDNTLLAKKPVTFYRSGAAFRPLLERAVALYKTGRVKTATAYLNAVLGELLELMILEDRSSAAEDITVQLLSYCAEHYAEGLTVSSIAEALYISESYVSKIFSQKLRYSFREYINALRIHKAQALLKDTDQKILQIMAECGYRNQSSFNRAFREVCGLSPRAFREQNKPG